MGFPTENKPSDAIMHSPLIQKMKYADWTDFPDIALLYMCWSCDLFYDKYTTLLEHLYWRHGTEGKSCPNCPVKVWDFAGHRCNVIPLSGGMEDTENLNLTSDSDNEEECDIKVTMINIAEVPESERASDFCFCGKHIIDAKMIGCDNPNCKFEWFHYQCVGIEVAPQGNWFCPQCT